MSGTAAIQCSIFRFFIEDFLFNAKEIADGIFRIIKGRLFQRYLLIFLSFTGYKMTLFQLFEVDCFTHNKAVNDV